MSAWFSDRWLERLGRDRAALAALAFLVLMTLFSVAGPWLSPHGESELDVSRALEGPTASRWFGRDELGRDLMTRVMHGGRISLAVGVMGAAVSVIVGTLVGGLAGFLGGWPERIIMRLIDFLYGVPLLLIVIALMVVLGQGLSNVFIALGLVYWLGMARVVRARVAELRGREFVEAARALGATGSRIFFTHLLPNTVGVIVVTATFMIPQAIFAESFLSFLGMGVLLPHASWGTLAADGSRAMLSHPHELAFPALAICFTIFAFQTLGEGLRAALDPRESEND